MLQIRLNEKLMLYLARFTCSKSLSSKGSVSDTDGNVISIIPRYINLSIDEHVNIKAK